MGIGFVKGYIGTGSQEKDLIRYIIGNQIRELVPIEYYIAVMEASGDDILCLESKLLDTQMWLVIKNGLYVYIVGTFQENLRVINNLSIDRLGYGEEGLEVKPDVIWWDYISGPGNKVLRFNEFTGGKYGIVRAKGSQVEIIGEFNDLSLNENIIRDGNFDKSVCMEWNLYRNRTRYCIPELTLQNHWIISLEGGKVVKDLNNLHKVVWGKPYKEDRMEFIEVVIE